MAGRGGKREGAGRKAGIPNKATAEIKEAAREISPAATRRLKKLVESENENVALGAIKEVLDRAYGKAAQPVGGGDGTEPLKHLFGWMSDGS